MGQDRKSCFDRFASYQSTANIQTTYENQIEILTEANELIESSSHKEGLCVCLIPSKKRTFIKFDAPKYKKCKTNDIVGMFSTNDFKTPCAESSPEDIDNLSANSLFNKNCKLRMDKLYKLYKFLKNKK